MANCIIVELPKDLWDMANFIMDDEEPLVGRPFEMDEQVIRMETFKEYLGLCMQEMYCLHYRPSADYYVCPVYLRAMTRRLQYDSTIYKLFDKVRRNFEEFSIVMTTANEIAVKNEVLECPMQKRATS